MNFKKRGLAMTEALYFLDCYLTEFKATVEKVTDGKFVVLDRTAFYPESGGQPGDTGKLVRESDGAEFEVLYVGKFNGEISHEIAGENVSAGLKAGDKVKGFIDWDRRYRHMRMHTATHVIANVIEKEAGAQITGNQLGLDQSRVDFSLEVFDRDRFTEYEKIANDGDSPGITLSTSIWSAVKKPKRSSQGLPPLPKVFPKR